MRKLLILIAMGALLFLLPARGGGRLLATGAGCVVGLAVFSSVLSWLLDRYHDLVIAAMIGLMIGSLRVLWPWPNGVGIISDVAGESVSGTGLELPAGDQWPAPTLLGLAAFALVVAISRLAPISEEPNEHPPVDSEPARRHSH